MDMQIVKIYRMRKIVIEPIYVQILKENFNVKIAMKIINAFQKLNSVMVMMIAGMEVMKKVAHVTAQIPLVAKKSVNALL